MLSEIELFDYMLSICNRSHKGMKCVGTDMVEISLGRPARADASDHNLRYPVCKSQSMTAVASCPSLSPQTPSFTQLDGGQAG